MLTKITTLTLSCLAAIGFSAACAAEGSYNVNQINIPEKPEFMASLGIAKAYHEKADQHFMSVHAQKGVSCNTCHDPRSLDGVAWMAVVNKPVIRQTCQDCHTVQADVFAHTDTHDKLDCIACHMPNVASAADYSTDQNAAGPKALRRIHTYKILVDPKASSMVEGEVKVGKDGTAKGYVMAKDEDGNGYVDLMWSCARNTPADYTVFEGKGCHNPATSKLDEGLIYQEVTRLSPADQTDARLLLDKADQIATMIKKDGSWGMHAQNYLLDQVKTAQAYLAKAQQIMDKGGYNKIATK